MAVAAVDRVRWALHTVFLLALAALAFSAMADRGCGQSMDPRQDTLFGPPRGSGYRPFHWPQKTPGDEPRAAAKKTGAADSPPGAEPLRPGDLSVVEVRIVGNDTIKKEKILPHIRTRAGRPFREAIIHRDVRQLYKTGMFAMVEPLYQPAPGGRVVIFKVVERPMLKYVKYVGNRKVKDKDLAGESGLAAGDAADPFAVEEARRVLEEFYAEKGFTQARVSIREGNKQGDRGAIFVIREGPKQKVVWTRFIGNTIASDQRLLTQVETKPGILWVFKGEFDRKKIQADEDTLVAYYRSLGFFHARVGHETSYVRFPLPWSNPNPVVTYVIDEGPRWKVHDVSFIGNSKLATAKLQEAIQLRTGDFFSQGKMDGDVRRISEQYGSVGYIFPVVKAEPRFLEETGLLDLVYKIEEGDRYRVGRINPKISGESPHTKITVLLNQTSLLPGDIVDTREIQASERRYRYSHVFNLDPQRGKLPKIVFSPADAKEIEDEPPARIARPPQRPGTSRGQSPDHGYGSPPGGRWPYHQDGGTR